MPVGDGRWRVRRAEVPHRTPYFQVVRSELARPDGSVVEYHTLDFFRPAVSVVLRDASGAVCLIRQQRFIVGRDVWSLPSGSVEDDETPEQAAARELVQETGLAAERLDHLVSYYPSYGVSNQVFHCFLAEEPRPVGEFDHNEVQQVGWFSEKEVLELIRNGEIVDGLSLPPLLYFASGMAAQPNSEIERCRRVRLDQGSDDA